MLIPFIDITLYLRKLLCVNHGAKIRSLKALICGSCSWQQTIPPWCTAGDLGELHR